MNNQTIGVQILEYKRVVYVKPNLEKHPQYKAVTSLCCTVSSIGQPLDLISNPGLELIPDPVDIGI